MTKPKGALHRRRFPSDYNKPQTVEVAKAALELGPFVSVKGGYGTGRRMFSSRTIEALVQSGDAVRLGSGVVSPKQLREARAIVQERRQAPTTTPSTCTDPKPEGSNPMTALKIKTHCDPKPIPVRQFDWVATEDGYEPGRPLGFGETEQEAVDDLLEQLE